MAWIIPGELDWHLGVFLLALDGILVFLSWLHILLNKRKTASVLLWLIVVAGLPVLGTLAYVVLGYDRHGRRATAKELAGRVERERLQGIDQRLAPLSAAWSGPCETQRFPDSLDPFGRLLSRAGRFHAVDGCTLELLDGGDAIYEAQLQAIAEAERAVLLEVYILETDAVGRRVLDALGEAAKRGVQCRLLYDAIGSSGASGSVLDEARRQGVDVRAFDQRARLRGRFQINLRNHRKILVVDGRIGFTGSANVSKVHLEGTPEDERSEDLHFRLRGPVVAQLSAVFAEDWYSTTGEALEEALFFPESEADGGALCRTLPSGPDGDYGAFHEVLVAAIHGAQRSVRIVTPYFIPSDEVSLALRVAAKRGVKVEVLVPGQLDHAFIRWAMNAFLEPLLRAGVRIRRRPGAFLHAKVLLVDDLWALVGSSNVDPRSYFLNYELNLGVVGEAELTALGRWVEDQWGSGAPIDREEFARRSVGRRAWENFWALFAPLL